MIAANDLLVLVDCDYAYHGARAAYGDVARVSYYKLKELIQFGRPDTSVYHWHAFIAVKTTPSNTGQLQLVSRLSQWDFDVHTSPVSYDEATGEARRERLPKVMLEFLKEFRCNGGFPQTVVVVSESPVLADLYVALLYQGVRIELLTWKPLSDMLFEISAHQLLTEHILSGSSQTL